MEESKTVKDIDGWWMVEAGWWCSEAKGYFIVEEDAHKWYIYPHHDKGCFGPFKTLKAAIAETEKDVEGNR